MDNFQVSNCNTTSVGIRRRTRRVPVVNWEMTRPNACHLARLIHGRYERSRILHWTSIVVVHQRSPDTSAVSAGPQSAADPISGVLAHSVGRPTEDRDNLRQEDGFFRNKTHDEEAGSEIEASSPRAVNQSRKLRAAATQLRRAVACPEGPSSHLPAMRLAPRPLSLGTQNLVCHRSPLPELAAMRDVRRPWHTLRLKAAPPSPSKTPSELASCGESVSPAKSRSDAAPAVEPCGLPTERSADETATTPDGASSARRTHCK